MAHLGNGWPRIDKSNVNTYRKDGVLPLIYAAGGRGGDVGTLLFLGADVEARADDGKNALMEAACYGKPQIVEDLFLHRKECNLEVRDYHHGQTALLWAAKSHPDHASVAEYGEVVELLVGRGADIAATNKDGDTALHLAATAGNARVVHFLLSKGGDLSIRNKEGLTPIDVAKNHIITRIMTVSHIAYLASLFSSLIDSWVIH